MIVSDIIPGDGKMVAANKTILEGALGAEFGFDPNNEVFKKLSDAYMAKYGVELPFKSYAQTEYDAMYILKDGIMAVGNDGKALASWIRTIKDWKGAAGSLTMKQDGDPVGGHVPKIIKDGVVTLYQK